MNTATTAKGGQNLPPVIPPAPASSPSWFMFLLTVGIWLWAHIRSIRRLNKLRKKDTTDNDGFIEGLIKAVVLQGLTIMTVSRLFLNGKMHLPVAPGT